MRRCKCLRYMALVANRRGESVYIFQENSLQPVEAVYPLEDFEKESGRLIVICPLYNYLFEDKLIFRAYEKYREGILRKEDEQIIELAIKECPNKVSPNKFLIFSERHKEIIEEFCRRYKLRMTWKLVKKFIAFLKVRKQYKNDELCRDVSPSERKECFDQLWLKAFEEFLKDVNYTIS